MASGTEKTSPYALSRIDRPHPGIRHQAVRRTVAEVEKETGGHSAWRTAGNGLVAMEEEFTDQPLAESAGLDGP